MGCSVQCGHGSVLVGTVHDRPPGASSSSSIPRVHFLTLTCKVTHAEICSYCWCGVATIIMKTHSNSIVPSFPQGTHVRLPSHHTVLFSPCGLLQLPCSGLLGWLPSTGNSGSSDPAPWRQGAQLVFVTPWCAHISVYLSSN